MKGLLNFQDPEQMGLLGISAGLLQASGPSRMPISLGQGIGMGLNQGMQFAENASQMQNRTALTKSRLDAEKSAAQQAAETQQRLSQFAATLPPDQQMRFMVDPKSFLENKVVAPGSSLVGGAGVQYTQPNRPADPTSEVRNFEYARGQGFKGSFQDFILEQRKAGANSTSVVVGGPQTPGDKKVDETFAAEMAPFITGGYADTVKQLDQLKGAVDSLTASPEGSLTGPQVGIMPRQALSVINPKAAAIQENVEEVVQRNLRLVLGAQYTEKEGERLIARAYNPYLSQAENSKRVNRLITQIKTAADEKLAASKYFQEKGTLKGYKGKTWTMKDFDPEQGSSSPQYDPATLQLLDKYDPQK
jgi:hypothetical protein